MPWLPRVPGVPRRGAGRRARRRLRALRQALSRRLSAPRHGHRAQVRLEVQGDNSTHTTMHVTHIV